MIWAAHCAAFGQAGALAVGHAGLRPGRADGRILRHADRGDERALIERLGDHRAGAGGADVASNIRTPRWR